MTTLYKLTTHDNLTRKGYDNQTSWGAGVEHTASGEGPLCDVGWLHAYEHPLLAVLLNPTHANIHDPKMWFADGDVGKRDGLFKVGCTRLRTVEEIPLPEIDIETRVEIAIWLASEVYDDPAWVAWARGWLSGKDRSIADAAADAAWRAAAADSARRAADAAADDLDLVGIVEAVVAEHMGLCN